MHRIFRLIAIGLVAVATCCTPDAVAQECSTSYTVASSACSDEGTAFAAAHAAATAYVAWSATTNDVACYNNTTAASVVFAIRLGGSCTGSVNRYFTRTFPNSYLCSTRPDQYDWMPPGGTAGESVCSNGCRYDYVLDASPTGNFFAPSGGTCLPGDFPAPQVDTDGDGVPDDEDAFPDDPNESQDTDGDGIGDNADHSPDDPTNGEDDGEGNESDNTATGGADCNAPPSCKGDGIACNTNYQIWKHRCETWGNVTGDPTVCNAAYSCVGNPHQCAQIALLRKTACSNALTGNIDSDGDGFGLGDKGNLQAIKDAITAESVDAGDAPDMPFVDGSGEGQTWSSGLGGGSCPAPISRTVTIGGYSQAIEFSFGPICEFSLLIKGIVLLGSAIVSAYIISGVRK